MEVRYRRTGRVQRKTRWTLVIPLTNENLILLPIWIMFFFCNNVQRTVQAKEAHGTGDYNQLTLLIYNRTVTATLELLICVE